MADVGSWREGTRAGALGVAGFALDFEAGVHRGADGVEAGDEGGVVDVVERVAVGRAGDDGAGGGGLVVVVDDLWEPLEIELAGHVGGLGLVEHEEVAVVIVADVFLVEAREGIDDALGGLGAAHIPRGNEFLAVGIRVREEDDALVEDAERLGIGAAGELPEGLDELVGADGLGGVEAAVDPDDGTAFGGEGAGVGFGEAFGAGEALGDGAIVVELREVRGGGADDHPLRAAFGGAADVDQADAVGRGGEFFEVGFRLRVGGEVVIVTDREAEVGFRSGELGGGRGGGGAQEAEEEGQWTEDGGQRAEHVEEERVSDFF